MKVDIISKKEFAKLAGVNPSAVTQAFPKTHPACEGPKINKNHPEAIAYIAQKPFRDEKKALKKQNINDDSSNYNHSFVVPEVPNQPPKLEIPEALAKLTLEEIVQTYGGLAGFKMYIKTAKDLEDYQTSRTKHAEKRGDLIDKSYEAKLLFEALEMLFDRLVNDIPGEVTQRVISIIKRGEVDSDLVVQKVYTEANSRALKICKNELLDQLKLDEYKIKSEL